MASNDKAEYPYGIGAVTERELSPIARCFICSRDVYSEGSYVDYFHIAIGRCKICHTACVEPLLHEIHNKCAHCDELIIDSFVADPSEALSDPALKRMHPACWLASRNPGQQVGTKPAAREP